VSRSIIPEVSPDASQSAPYAVNLFYFFATLLVAHHIYSAFFPSSINWGFHHLAFFSVEVKVVWILLALLVLIPTTRRYLLEHAEKLIKKASGLPRHVAILVQ
jgi:hypothetical protein